jgi:hypothetical protein
MLDRSSPIAKPSSQRSQAVPIRAELVDNLCTAAGLTARGFAPVIMPRIGRGRVSPFTASALLPW